MRLYDDNNNIKGVGKHSGSFMYKSEFKRRSEIKSGKKKHSALSGESSLFEDEPIEFNDLDLNILNRSLIKYLPTDALRLELMLERAEKRLEKVTEEINTSRLLKISESDKDDFLEKKKKRLINDINGYKSEYRKLGFVYKLADILADLRNKIILIINFIKNFMFSIPYVSVLLDKIPWYRQKQKLKKLHMLQRKFQREFNKKQKTDNEKMEHLFIKTEELT